MPEMIGGRSDKSHLESRYGPAPEARLEKLVSLENESSGLSVPEQQRVADQLAQEIQQESDPVVRRQIIRSMTFLRSPAADHIIRAGLHGDKDTSVRIACCKALGRRGGTESVRELLTVLNHDDNIDVRLAAIRAIGVVGDPRVVPALGGAINPKEDPALQHRTAQVLQSLTGQQLGNDLVAWRSYVASGVVPPRKPEPSLAERTLGWWR